MKNILTSIIYLIVIGISLSANAAVEPHQNVTINNIVHWSEADPTYFELSTGKWCFIRPEEKQAYSIILTLYSTTKKQICSVTIQLVMSHLTVIQGEGSGGLLRIEY